MFLFLQTWRAAIIPIIAIPVSLIGTFAVLAALGFSLNNLSLFGLVLAIGIVVDDAIVVVENVERNLARGHDARRRPRIATMDEVGGALIAIALMLCAVFVPAAFISGHLRPVLPPVRGHDRGLDGDLLLRLADPEPGALRAAAQAARRRHAARTPLLLRPVRGFFERLQPRLRLAVARLWRPDPAAGAGRRRWCWWSMPG